MIRVARQRGAGDREILPLLLVGNGIVGGMEEYVLNLLRRFAQRERRALVGAPFVGEFTAALLDQGFPAADLHVLDMSDQIHVGALAQLVTFVRARGVSLVHTNLQPADTLGAAAAAHAGVPCLSTLHGLYRCREELLLRDLYGLEFVAVSEAGRASAIDNGLPPDAVRVLLNGVDPDRFDPDRFDRDHARAALGIAPDQVLVTCVSRLAREKSPELFLHAAEVAAAADPRLVFALVGSGPLEAYVRQIVAASPARDRLRLLGSRRDIPEILAATDVAALSSRTESLPFSILEAMAMRLPVVAHDVGGVGEAVRDGMEGCLVEFGRLGAFAARLAELAADPALRARMGEAGRRRVLDSFDIRRTADELLELYADLVTRGRPAVASRATGLEPPARRVLRSGNGRGNGASRRVPAATATRGAGPRGGISAGPIVDAHLHLSGRESSAQVLDTLERAGVTRACLIGPFLDPETWIPASGAALERANAYLLDLVSTAPDRLWALVSVDPRERQAPKRVGELARDPAVRGLKLVPHGWRPDGGGALAVYEAAESAGLPILFHSGVFISGRAADACRPALYESVRRFPRLRVVLAHLGWPWVDEAIAVAFMDLLRGRPPQILLDLSPGTPPVYRADALRRAFSVLGASALVFGSDRFFPLDPDPLRDQVGADRAQLREAGAGPDELRAVLHDNAYELFGRRPAARTSPAAPAPAVVAVAGAGAVTALASPPQEET